MSQFDPTDLEAQEKRAADQRVKQRISKDTEEQDFKWLMGSRRGRRIIWRTLERAGVFRLSFNTDPLLMSFTEGNRNEGIHTLTLIHSLCPELYATMVREAHDRTNEHSTGSSRSDSSPGSVTRSPCKS